MLFGHCMWKIKELNNHQRTQGKKRPEDYVLWELYVFKYKLHLILMFPLFSYSNFKRCVQFLVCSDKFLVVSVYSWTSVTSRENFILMSQSDELLVKRHTLLAIHAIQYVYVILMLILAFYMFNIFTSFPSMQIYNMAHIS